MIIGYEAPDKYHCHVKYLTKVIWFITDELKNLSWKCFCLLLAGIISPLFWSEVYRYGASWQYMHSTISIKDKALTVTPTGNAQWFLLQIIGRNLASGPQLNPLSYRSPLGWHYFISSYISSGPFSNFPFSSFRGFFPGVHILANEERPHPSGKRNRSPPMTKPRLLFSDESLCALKYEYHTFVPSILRHLCVKYLSVLTVKMTF